MNISSRLDKHFAVAAAAVAVAGAANAAIVVWNINAAVPATIDGVYLNVEAQTSGSAGAAVAGWDLNPYGATAMSFFWSGSTNGSSAGVRLNTVAGGSTNGSTLSNLSQGFVVGASLVGGSSGASFGGGSANFTQSAQGRWNLNAVNYFGFRFTNAANQVRYGWGSMQMGATAAVRTILTIAYEDSGGSIQVGAVPAPGAIALLGVAGLVSRRRR